MRLFPLARVVVVVPFLFIPLFFEVYAFVFIGLWFLLQVLQSLIALLLPAASGDVAWWAHVGGFIAGFALGRCWSDPNSATECTTRTKACSALIPRGEYEISCQKESSMSIGDLFWLFFIFSAIQPMLRQKMLEAMRVRKISQLERERKSRVILLVHRQETMRLLGFPIARYIDINDSEEVLRAIQMTDPDVPLDLVLHTPGGLVLAALQIAKAVREHKGKVTVFVPHYAMSGGTLIALAADEIVMCEHSVLGPIDPQLGESPAASLIKVVEEKPVAKVDDRTLIMADVGRKAITQVKQAASELLTRRLPAEQATALAEKLSTGTWTHDYPIWASTGKSLGLSISTDMPDDVLQLLTLYPQPVRLQNSGGVEYLPVERRKLSESRAG
jgi:ClpP class serine protease